MSLESKTCTPRRTQSPRVVLAEDDAELRRLLVSALRDDGYDITDVSTGSALLAALRESWERGDRPSLIITDEVLPDIRGLHVLKQTQEWDWTGPLVLFTAFGDDDVLQRASEAGVTVLHKPFDLNDFRTVVRWLVHGDSQTAAEP